MSRLAAGVATSVADQISRESTLNNERDGITGLLTFDGANFAQSVEGPPAAVADLLGRLKADPRHGDLDVMYSGPVASQRYPGWKLGFLRPDLAEFQIASLRGQRGSNGIEAFAFIVPALDIAPLAPAHAPKPLNSSPGFPEGRCSSG